MSGSDPTKLTPRLAERLESVRGSDVVDVVVELQPVQVPPTGSRSERVASAKSEFERELVPVADRIAQVGGRVLDTAWLNQTLRGRIPAEGLAAVAAEDAVVSIDIPHPLLPE